MTKLLAGAMALALLGGSAAVAQPYNHDRGGDANQGGDHQGDHRGGDRGGHDQGGDRGDHGRDHHHRGHMVCTWRHHHRVCYRQHW